MGVILGIVINKSRVISYISDLVVIILLGYDDIVFGGVLVNLVVCFLEIVNDILVIIWVLWCKYDWGWGICCWSYICVMKNKDEEEYRENGNDSKLSVKFKDVGDRFVV